MVRIYNILVSLFGESKQGYFDKGCTQYQFNSPWATEERGGTPDGKFNLEISFALGKYHEWSSNNGGNISRLIKEFGGKALADEYYNIIKELRESNYYNIDLFKDDNGILDEEGNILRLPKTFKKIDLSTCRKTGIVEYLKKRKITQDIIDKYNIGYTEWDGEDRGWRNRIIIPSYNCVGDLNYFVGRIYSDKDKRIKYKNCTADKKKIILHEDKIQWDAPIYLVEGTFDCIYFENCLSLLGKTLTVDSEIYQKLKERSHSDIIIAIDGDTTEDEVKRMYSLLDRGKLRGRIRYIRLGTKEIPYKDFGEIYESEGKEGIIKAMKCAKQYSEIEILI